MADVLHELGRFGATDLRVLLHPDSAKILGTIDDIAVKLREHDQRGEQAVVVFYYSGHAKANAFTLGDSALPLAALQGRLRQLPSTLTLVVVDACQSGAFARTKGAEPAADFSFNSVSRLTTKGIAVMASSTGQELSQESDALKSSYFTHHLVVALRGAGDADGDGRVSLDEAYRYAYRRTLTATARTRVGSQHATLETDLSGQGEVAVTYPRDARSQLELPAALYGRILVQHAASGSVVAELQKVVGTPLRLALPSGAYEATLRTSGGVMACRLTLSDDRVTAIDLGTCTLVSATGLAKGDEDAAPEIAASAEHAAETGALREIDRWGLEASVGFISQVDDAYTNRLGDFGYKRQVGFFIDLPSDRISVGATRILMPHVSLLFQAQSLAGATFYRDTGLTSSDTIDWKGYGAGVYLRASTDFWPRVFQAYVQAGGGASVAFSSLTTPGTQGTTTSKDTTWGYLLGAAGGVAVAPSSRFGGFVQVSYDHAPALPNLLGDDHNVGGVAVAAGLRFRFGEVGR